MRYVILILVAALALSGCSFYKVRNVRMGSDEMERVDQDLTGGNRGYLVGTNPNPPRNVKKTRKFLTVDMDLLTEQEAKEEQAQDNPNLK